MNEPNKCYGKYRGTVVNNLDPMQMGRILAQVPDVNTLIPTTWAMPCFPVAGLMMGIHAVPPVGAGVWIEFEQGDPDYPIWSGCFLGSLAEKPALSSVIPPGVPGITIQTPLQNGIVISDLPGPTGGIMLMSNSGASIMVNDTGIIIQNGKGASIVMAGNTVTINEGALLVV